MWYNWQLLKFKYPGDSDTENDLTILNMLILNVVSENVKL